LMHFFSIKAKIVIIPIICLLVAAGLVVVYSYYFMSNRAMADAKEHLSSITRTQAANIQAELTVGLDAARTLAQVLGKVRDHENPLDLQRYEALDLLQGILMKNEQFYGVFTCWEPNAFDEMDIGYANEPGHDESGRFAPYWYRGINGEFKLTPTLTCPYHSPGGKPGPWYEYGKKNRSGFIGEPVFHYFDGLQKLLAMAVVPLSDDHDFYGVTGIDFDLAFLQAKADSLNIFNHAARLIIVSNGGMILGYTGAKNLVSQPVERLLIDTGNLPAQINTGRDLVELHGNLLSAFAPIKVSESDKPWAVGIMVPVETITEATMNLMWKQIGIFTGVTILLVMIATVAARVVMRPLVHLLAGINRINDGDFSQDVVVKTHDEMGELATGFNLMRLKLQKTLADLKQQQEHLEDKVLQRTVQIHQKNEQLNKANLELQRAMDTIKETQEELLNTEKLAVVGQMSGIVAHEILNPVASISIRITQNLQLADHYLKVVDKISATVADLSGKWMTGSGRTSDGSVEHEQLSFLAKAGKTLRRHHEERQHDFQFLDKQINRVVKIVDGLRQMSKTKKHIEAVELDRVVHEVVDDMADVFRKRQISVRLDFASVQPIRADYMELYSVVSNLARNAMQALEKKNDREEKTISIVLKNDKEVISLDVRDNGTGLLPEVQEKLFEPGVTSKGRAGTGLGLSFSRRVARSYQGDIVLLATEPGKGTAFRVTLPFERDSRTEDAKNL
jgi:signal transduction histidine kinase